MRTETEGCFIVWPITRHGPTISAELYSMSAETGVQEGHISVPVLIALSTLPMDAVVDVVLEVTILTDVHFSQLVPTLQ